MKTMYDIQEAASFVELSVASIKHHVYKTGLLQGEVIHGGKVLVFSLDELRAFQHNRKLIHTGYKAGSRGKKYGRTPISNMGERGDFSYIDDQEQSQEGE